MYYVNRLIVVGNLVATVTYTDSIQNNKCLKTITENGKVYNTKTEYKYSKLQISEHFKLVNFNVSYFSKHFIFIQKNTFNMWVQQKKSLNTFQNITQRKKPIGIEGGIIYIIKVIHSLSTVMLLGQPVARD